MVGFFREPGSNARSFADEHREHPREPENFAGEWNIKTDTENVQEYFEQSDEFQRVGEGKYISDGFTVEVNEEGIDYQVPQGVPVDTVDEFVDIVSQFVDVEENFVPEVEQEIRDTAYDNSRRREITTEYDGESYRI